LRVLAYRWLEERRKGKEAAQSGLVAGPAV
jgi:hypothetical protein